MITVDTDLGTITVSKSMLRDIILEVIDSFHGDVFVSNSKGKRQKYTYRIGNLEEADEMEINLTGDGLEIRVYVVLKFGSSISRITQAMIKRIRYAIGNRAGIEIEKVTVVVTGMMSKKFSPRHIEVTG